MPRKSEYVGFLGMCGCTITLLECTGYRLARPIACGNCMFGCQFQVIEQLVATASASFVPSSTDDRIQVAGLL